MSYLALVKFAGYSHLVFYSTNPRTLGSGNIGFDAMLARRSDGLLKLRQAQRKWRHCVGKQYALPDRPGSVAEAFQQHIPGFQGLTKACLILLTRFGAAFG